MSRVVEKKKRKTKRRTKKSVRKNNKIIIIAIALLLIVAIAIFAVKKLENNNSDSEEKVAVQSVEIISGNLDNAETKFSGVVISQKTVKVSKQSNKTIKKVYVEVGQEVKAGDKLFEYDTDDINIKIEEANLEIEKLQNSISNANKQIENINAEIAANPETDSSSLKVDIQSLENEKKQAEFNIKSKNNEIDRMKKSLQDVVVKAEIDGIIQEVGEIDEASDNSSYTNNNQSNSFITIMQTGQYKIKGLVNEQNIFSINPGESVIIRSRVDDTKTWNGTIENIDTSNNQKTDNNYDSGNTEENLNKSSKYPFYVTLESMDGLILGQHVYIEKDIGQNKVKEGLWIPNYFILEEDGEYFAWVANSKDKLEKKKIEVEEKDEELGKYQIKNGLTIKDYIAIPNESLTEGMEVNKYDVAEIPVDFGESSDEVNTDENNEVNSEGNNENTSEQNTEV